MYKNIEVFEISKIKILVQETGCEQKSINLPSELDFAKYDDLLDYETDSGSIRIYKRFMIIKISDLSIRIYIPKPVRHLIMKDIQKNGLFSLSHRKHLYKEYDSEKHVLIKVNHIPEDREFLIDSAQNKTRKYSTGVHCMPLLICFYDNVLDRLSYNIVKENIILETGVIDASACNDYLKIAA